MPLMKIVCASDIHGLWNEVEWPAGDVLILAGDILHNYASGRGCDIECGAQLHELDMLGEFLAPKYKSIVIVPGNHDWVFQRAHSKDKAREICANHLINLLIDEGVEIDGIKFWGSPWQPFFYDWAFNFPNPHEDEARAHAHTIKTWDMIPTETQVLITHGPPLNTLDKCWDGRRVGCKYLAQRVAELVRYNLFLHVFGHIHHSAGSMIVDRCRFVNAAILNEEYAVDNKPTVIELFN